MEKKQKKDRDLKKMKKVKIQLGEENNEVRLGAGVCGVGSVFYGEGRP